MTARSTRQRKAVKDVLGAKQHSELTEGLTQILNPMSLNAGSSKMKKHDVLTLLFLGSTILSTVAMAVAVGNYMEFFPAMERVAVRVASVEFQLEEPAHKIIVLFVVDNPTGYSGLGVRSFQPSLTFEYPNGTTVPYGAPPSLPKGTVFLAPYSRLEVPREVSMPTATWGAIAQDLAEGESIAQFSVTLGLSTFLDSVSWIIINYSCTVASSPVNCERGGASAVPRTTSGGL